MVILIGFLPALKIEGILFNGVDYESIALFLLGKEEEKRGGRGCSVPKTGEIDLRMILLVQSGCT